jgi:hypothetical protein
MHRSLRLPIALLGFVIVLAILASGSFLLNKWLPQPDTYAPSTGSPIGDLANDPLEYLPDTGLVQLTSPISTTSYYVRSLNDQAVMDLGYALGQQDIKHYGTQEDLVILDYGYPYFQGGSYGVYLIYDNHFYNTTSVANSIKKFADGWKNGSDTTSNLTIVAGVNNCCIGTPSLWPNHGSRWATEVVSVTNHLINNSRIKVIGGMDIEMGWNYPYASRQWLDSYMSNSNCTPGTDDTADGCFVNFGIQVVSASGTTCQTLTLPTVAPGTPTPDPLGYWDGCDVWYPSWGAQRSGQSHFARPLPEIYTGIGIHPPWGSNANAWATMSVFSDQQMHAGPMLFAGSLTERESCNDACGYGNNYPWEGFQLLSGALASNPTTRQGMRWSTDIKKQQTPTPHP